MQRVMFGAVVGCREKNGRNSATKSLVSHIGTCIAHQNKLACVEKHRNPSTGSRQGPNGTIVPSDAQRALEALRTYR
jgi:hypothetical protein